LGRRYAKLPFALRSEEAAKQIEKRQQEILAKVKRAAAAAPEEIAVKRRIK
jgi:hypothetical protein